MKTRMFILLSLFVAVTLFVPDRLWSTTAPSQPPLLFVPGVSRVAGAVSAYTQVANTLASTDVMFIENVGQFAEGARFQVRGADRTVWLAEDGIWVTVMEPRLPDGRPASPFFHQEREEVAGERGEIHGVNLKLSFPGTNPHPRLEPFNRLDTVVSYFIGNDPEKWRTNVPVWGGVRYVDLYPGVDLEIAGRGGSWTWRLVCSEADCQSALQGMRLWVEGADAVEVLPSPSGRGARDEVLPSPASGEEQGWGLHLTTAVGEFTLPPLIVEDLPLERPNAPRAIVQQVRTQIFDIVHPFSTSPTHPLSPSSSAPSLAYAGFLGGSSGDDGWDIAVDEAGNAYITGDTISNDFPAVVGPDLSRRDKYDTFVVKVRADGTGLAYAGFLGGWNDDFGDSIAVDGSGNAYITGSTLSSDFPAVVGPDLSHEDGWDAFVVKVNAAGTELVYAGFLGGLSEDWGYGIAVDGAGNAYVTGYTSSYDFPTVAGPDLSYNGSYDAFVVKVNATGTELAYAGFLGGSSEERGRDIAVDGSGNAYITGNTISSDFPAVVGPDLSYNDSYDAFVVKVNATGTELAYAGFLGGWAYDRGHGITVDKVGNAYVTGYTGSDDFPAVVGPGLSRNDGWDTFVVKVRADGTGLAYAGFLGGSADDWGYDIAVDGSGNAYITGSTLSSNFPAVVGPDLRHNGDWDAFVVKVNAAGTELAYAGFLGGSAEDWGCGIAVDGAGNAYVTGRTLSGDFPAAAGPDLSHNGGWDAFVVKVGGRSEAGPTPSGLLALLAASNIPTSRPLTAIAWVRNKGTSPQNYTLTVRLLQGGTTLDTLPFTFSLSPGAIAERTADFGFRPTGRYRVEAALSAGERTLATQSRSVLVTNSNAAGIILDHGGDLRATAHAELDDIAYIPSWALADEAVSFGLDKLEEKAISKFADFAAPIQDAGGIPRSTSNDAIAQIRGELGRVRKYKRNLSVAVRLFVRDYGVTLPKDFDPLDPDLEFITDPILKDRLKNLITGYVANFIRHCVVGPLWVNGPRSEVDRRHTDFEDFVLSRSITQEPPGLAKQMQHGRERIRNVVESDALITLGPYNVLEYTLRYDLTLQEQENKRQQIEQVSQFLGIAITVLVIIGVVITLLLIVGAISSGGTLAVVVAPIIWKIVNVLKTVSDILKVAAALLVVLMLFTVSRIAPHVPQYHDEALDAAETLISSTGMAQLNTFDVTVQSNQARLIAQMSGPETGQAQVLVETVLYSVDGRIISVVWSPVQIRAGQQATLSKHVPLAPGTYRAVTTLYANGEAATTEAVSFSMPAPGVEMALSLTQSRLNPAESLQARVSLTNTSPISDVNDLTLIVESTDGVHFNAWPVSLAAGATRQIDYTFTPTTTGAYVLRAWLGIGLNTLAQQDAAYVVGSGPALALNTSVSDVYTPGLAVTLPLTLTNVGDVPDAVTITMQTVDRLHTGVMAFSSTLTTTIPASGTVFATITALPDAQPGLYAVQLDVNGVAYDTRDFAVSAVDTLFGLLTVGDLWPPVGQNVPVTATVRTADDMPASATITVAVQFPTGALMVLPMLEVSTGVYRTDFTPVISGTYSLELAVSRTGYRGVGDRSFLVAGAPTLLLPAVEGELQAGEIRAITVTVHSEDGVPVPAATVVLSGTQEILRGETDVAGRVVLQTFPPDARPYMLTTEKMGYAGATTEIEVGWLKVYLPLVLRDSP